MRIQGAVELIEIGPTDLNRRYASEFLALFSDREKLRIRKIFEKLETNRHKIHKRREHAGNFKLDFLTTLKPRDPLASVDKMRRRIVALLQEEPQSILASTLREHIYLLHRLEARLAKRVMPVIARFIQNNDCRIGSNFIKITALEKGLRASDAAKEAFSNDGIDFLCGLLSKECLQIATHH